MVDQTNFRIIQELTKDGRSSNALLAKKLHLNIATVAKRVDTMIRENIIEIRTLPNPAKMGYQAGAVICLTAKPDKLEDICLQLKDNAHINLLVITFGRFDIIIVVYFKEWLDIENFLDEVLAKIEGISQIETFLISSPKKRYLGVFCDDTLNHIEPVELDDTDEKLIKELLLDARPSYTELAGKLGVSRSTISRRIHSLIQRDIIRIMAIPNPIKLGYSANALIAIDASPDKVVDICTKLRSYKEVHIMFRLMNGFDILFGINSSSNKKLYEFIRKDLAGIDGVLHTETFILGDLSYFSADAVFLPTDQDIS